MIIYYRYWKSRAKKAYNNKKNSKRFDSVDYERLIIVITLSIVLYMIQNTIGYNSNVNRTNEQILHQFGISWYFNGTDLYVSVQ